MKCSTLQNLLLKVLTGCSLHELEKIDISCLDAINLKELKELFSCGEQVVLFLLSLFIWCNIICSRYICQSEPCAKMKESRFMPLLSVFLISEASGGPPDYMTLLLLFLKSN